MDQEDAAERLAIAATIKPDQDYLLVEILEEDNGIYKSADFRDSEQKGRVLAAGPGCYDHGVFIDVTTKVGDIIIWEEAGGANTPPNLKNKGLQLVKEARKIATVLPQKTVKAKKGAK